MRRLSSRKSYKRRKRKDRLNKRLSGFKRRKGKQSRSVKRKKLLDKRL
jgi:hypothetical protein